MATFPQSSTTSTGSGRNRILIGIGIIATMLLIGAVSLIWFFNGQSVAGSEFCPQTFQLRSFSYRRLPWLKTIVVPTTHRITPLPVSTPVLQHVKKLPGERWDIVSVNEGVKLEVRAPEILLQSISGSSANGSFWDKWSEKHPEMAAVTWPIVQQAAMANAYDKIPNILEFALEITTSGLTSPDAMTNKWIPILEKLNRNSSTEKE